MYSYSKCTAQYRQERGASHCATCSGTSNARDHGAPVALSRTLSRIKSLAPIRFLSSLQFQTGRSLFLPVLSMFPLCSSCVCLCVSVWVGEWVCVCFDCHFFDCSYRNFCKSIADLKHFSIFPFCRLTRVAKILYFAYST